jgi:hypothetical protein
VIVQRGLADGPMLVSGGVQFVVGGVLEGQQGIVRARHGQQDLVELALSRPLVAGLGVLDHEDHGQRHGGYQCLEDGFPPGRESRRDAGDDPRSGRPT